jgi:hypothetical protein
MERSIKIQFPLIEGNVWVAVSKDANDESVYLHGDPAGLLSLAKILTTLAEIDQKTLPALPTNGATEHIHLEPDFDLSANSKPLVVGRLDDKGGKFDETFRQRCNKRTTPIMNRW